ncbi:hypothetical protein BaRGS_00011593 [Batillaria attramentaria]|uniref:Uncharacterized protein n=1 Tax=Batillaria attramentaria TaxID=370345 RepID=A0ABD0LCV7_9CAEN
MVSRSTARIKPVEIGDNVLPVPKFDRSRGDPANLLGVILDNGVNGLRVGTKVGILSGKFPRNQLELTTYKGTKEMIPQSETTVRSAVRMMPVGHGQGFRKCHCQSTCLTVFMFESRHAL